MKMEPYHGLTVCCLYGYFPANELQNRTGLSGWSGRADTLYLDIACWGSLGDFCMESICKGQTVRVVGRIKNSTYKSPDGSREYSRFSILAQHITFRQRKQNGEGEKEEEITLNAGNEDNAALLAEPIVVYEY